MATCSLTSSIHPFTRLLGYVNPENRNALVETTHGRRWW